MCCWLCIIHLIVKMFSRKRVLKAQKRDGGKESSSAAGNLKGVGDTPTSSSFFARILGNARGTASCIDLSKSTTSFSISADPPPPIDDLSQRGKDLRCQSSRRRRWRWSGGGGGEAEVSGMQEIGDNAWKSRTDGDQQRQQTLVCFPANRQ